MAINKNHEFEDLNGVKCAVVEKDASQERIDFLKPLLEFNGYTVMVVASPPPKTAPKPAPPVASSTDESSQENPTVPIAPAPPSTFTIGVTDVTFNSINAIFGRLLRTSGGHIVTLAYWEQQETESHDEIPYYERGL